MDSSRLLPLCNSILGLVFLLVTLSTDYWYMAIGPKSTTHSGIWSKEPNESVGGSIRVTQGFSLLAALWGMVAMVFLSMSNIPALLAPSRGPIVSCFMAFAAALSMVVAMAVYTAMRWSQSTDAQIQGLFFWSPVFLSTGGLNLGAQCPSPQIG